MVPINVIKILHCPLNTTESLNQDAGLWAQVRARIRARARVPARVQALPISRNSFKFYRSRNSVRLTVGNEWLGHNEPKFWPNRIPTGPKKFRSNVSTKFCGPNFFGEVFNCLSIKKILRRLERWGQVLAGHSAVTGSNLALEQTLEKCALRPIRLCYGEKTPIRKIRFLGKLSIWKLFQQLNTAPYWLVHVKDCLNTPLNLKCSSKSFLTPLLFPSALTMNNFSFAESRIRTRDLSFQSQPYQPLDYHHGPLNVQDYLSLLVS